MITFPPPGLRHLSKQQLISPLFRPASSCNLFFTHLAAFRLLPGDVVGHALTLWLLDFKAGCGFC